MRSADAGLDDPVAWGRRLIETRDVDPVYDALVGAFWRCDGGSDALFLHDPERLARWLLAYWCFYHAGVASYLADTDDYWAAMLMAANNQHESPLGGRWPRAAERRHFRGTKCVDAVLELRLRAPRPIDLVDFLVSSGASEVMARVQTLPLFGPWIAFKAADMLERVLGRPIAFSRDTAMYDSPRRGLQEIVLLGATKGCVNEVLSTMLETYESLSPPGLQSRGCGLQEVETILCKWGSACSGHYHIGKDLLEVRAALAGWGATADALLRSLPPPVSEET